MCWVWKKRNNNSLSFCHNLWRMLYVESHVFIFCNMCMAISRRTWCVLSFFHLSRRMTKPTKWPVRPAQSDQSLRCALNGYLKIQCFFMRTAKTLIRLGGCPGWSESLLGAHVILLVKSCCGSFYNHAFWNKYVLTRKNSWFDSVLIIVAAGHISRTSVWTHIFWTSVNHPEIRSTKRQHSMRR